MKFSMTKFIELSDLKVNILSQHSVITLRPKQELVNFIIDIIYDKQGEEKIMTKNDLLIMFGSIFYSKIISFTTPFLEIDNLIKFTFDNSKELIKIFNNSFQLKEKVIDEINYNNMNISEFFNIRYDTYLYDLFDIGNTSPPYRTLTIMPSKNVLKFINKQLAEDKNETVDQFDPEDLRFIGFTTLFPFFEKEEDQEEFIKTNYELMLELFLCFSLLDTKYIPKEKSYEKFKEWTKIIISDMLLNYS